MIYLNIIGLILLVLGIFLFILDVYLIKDKKTKLIRKNHSENFAILIPARYESKVIENLFKSISNQSININMKDVYVIVEDKKDKTVDIAKQYGISVFIREKLDLKTKGYALMEIVEHLIKNDKYYDLYFIMDADNILDKDFIKNMLKSYEDGYDIVTGYRKSINVNENRVSISSALTFALINTLLNESRLKKNRPITVSGTGYFITKKLIKKWGSFPYHLLTEDYELSVDNVFNKYSTYYNKKAIFYDEQPTSIKQSMIQRTRWCKGYLQTRKKYHKKLATNLKDKSVIGEFIGIKPYILMVLAALLFYIAQIVLLIYKVIEKKSVLPNIFHIIAVTFSIYLILMIFTIIMIVRDKNNLELTNKSIIKAIFYNPVFLATYFICIIKALGRDNTWKEIRHKGI